MTIALKQMEIGAVYAIWSAVGTVMVSVLGVFLFHEPTNAMKVVAIFLIIAGVVCLDLSSRNGSGSVKSVQADLHPEPPLDHPPRPGTPGDAASPIAGGSVRQATAP